MIKPQQYAVALFALKVNPEWQAQIDEETKRIIYSTQAQPDEDGNLNLEPNFVVRALSIIAKTEDEAKESGLKFLHENYPESEGWACHWADTFCMDIDSLTREVKKQLALGVANTKRDDTSDDVLDADTIL